jgi:hypothetical protein
MKIPKNSLKIPNGLSAAVNQRKTDDTMAESKRTERQTTCSFAYYFFSLLSQPKLPDMTVTRQVPLVEHELLTLDSSQVFCEVYVLYKFAFFMERKFFCCSGK